MKGTSWAHVQEALSDLDFPAARDEIVAHAAEREDSEAVQLLRGLPPATYLDIAEVREALPLLESEVDRP